MLKLIRTYQKFNNLWGAFGFLYGGCRFYPTCSEYAVQSIEKNGLIKGVIKSIWRILRCNPFSKEGIDLV